MVSRVAFRVFDRDDAVAGLKGYGSGNQLLNRSRRLEALPSHDVHGKEILLPSGEEHFRVRREMNRGIVEQTIRVGPRLIGADQSKGARKSAFEIKRSEIEDIHWIGGTEPSRAGRRCGSRGLFKDAFAGRKVKKYEV